MRASVFSDGLFEGAVELHWVLDEPGDLAGEPGEVSVPADGLVCVIAYPFFRVNSVVSFVFELPQEDGWLHVESDTLPWELENTSLRVLVRHQRGGAVVLSDFLLFLEGRDPDPYFRRMMH